MQPMLTDSLRRAERLFARKEGVVCGEVRLTYAEFGSRCRRLASGLRRMGVSKGDRVAVLMGNGHRYLEAYSAIPGIGAAIVPLNTRHSIQEHRAILADCGARVLIADEAHRQVVNEVDVEEVLLAPDDYERLVATSAGAELGEGVGEEDLAGLFYTGGTTGAPKGVMLTHRNLVANAFHITIGFAYEEDDTFLHSAPMFHLADGSSIYALTWLGARHVFVSAFEPGAVLETIAHEGVTCTILVPTMIGALVDHPESAAAELSSLRLIPHGGAPIATGLLRRASAVLGCSFTQAYGLTESSSCATVLPREEHLLDDARLRSAGRPAMGVELAVRRPDSAVCEPDEVGEITLRGPNITSGYWNNPRETAKVVRDDWFWTGDLAYADEEGYVYIVDRKKDMIVSGGENVYSAEVEEAICAHPAVLEAAVIGVSDERWGERVHAVAVARPGRAPGAEELRSFCKVRIAGYKCPRSVEFVESLPKSGAGKVLKRELRARHWSGAGRQVR